MRVRGEGGGVPLEDKILKDALSLGDQARLACVLHLLRLLREEVPVCQLDLCERRRDLACARVVGCLAQRVLCARLDGQSDTPGVVVREPGCG